MIKLSKSIYCNNNRVHLITSFQICKNYYNNKYLKGRERFLEKQAKKAAELASLPDFKTLLRQFYRKAHPDILRSSDATAADVNNNSIQQLNGFLTIIKGTAEYPPAQTKFIPFYVMNENKTIIQHKLRLRTSGGDCKNSLNRCFAEFFKEIGILDKDTFKWNDEFFRPLELEASAENQNNKENEYY